MGSIISPKDRITSPIPELDFEVRREEQIKHPSFFVQRHKIRVYNSILPDLKGVIGEKEITKIQQLNKSISNEFYLGVGLSAFLTILLTSTIYRREKRFLQRKKLNMGLLKHIKYVPITILTAVGFHFTLYNILEKTSDLTGNIE
jgi:hypothetical protein